MTDAFEIDRDYDRDYASNGSRYAAYVGSRLDSFRETFDWGNTAFAARAWYVATSPVMSPGYVRYRHPRILGATLARSGWDGSLCATVELAVPWPAALQARPADWQGVDPEGRRRWWNDWPTDGYGEHLRYVDPLEQDVAARPHLMTTATALITLDTLGLPSVPVDDIVASAREAITVLVPRLNEQVGPILATLDGS